MTLRTFVTDTLKEWLLGFVIGVPLISALLWIIRWAGSSFVSYVVLFLFSFQIIAMVLYPTVIQPLFNKLTPLPQGALRDRVVALASSLKFPLKHIYVIDGSKRSSHSNAYFFGVIPGGNKHIVIFDTLIEKSSSDEIEAVLAHELGHYANNDPTKLLVLSQVQIWFTMSLFTLFINNVSLYRSFGFQVGPSLLEKAAGTPSSQILNYLPIIIGLELFQLVLNPTDALIKFLLNSAIRRMEYAADHFAATLSRPGPRRRSSPQLPSSMPKRATRPPRSTRTRRRSTSTCSARLSSSSTFTICPPCTTIPSSPPITTPIPPLQSASTLCKPFAPLSRSALKRASLYPAGLDPAIGHRTVQRTPLFNPKES